MTETTDPQPLCRTCVTPIGYIDAPTGGWWAHETHPADGHDAVPGGWVDGDELMEAIASAVWEHCTIEGTASLVVDDPRNIAGTAAAVARRLPAPADRAAELETENARMRHELEVMYGGAFNSLKPPSADRAALLTDEAALIEAHCPDHSDADGVWMDCHCPVAEDMHRRANELRRMADEAQQQTPCGPAPDECDTETGLCDNHEREQAHAEGEHELCGVTCEVEFPTEMLRNGILAKGYPGTAGMLDELLRRVAAGQFPADEAQPAPREWCKCPSCWGWFVEEHPGEDLDELGKDLGWWSGLPEHRDAPPAVEPRQADTAGEQQ